MPYWSLWTTPWVTWSLSQAAPAVRAAVSYVGWVAVGVDPLSDEPPHAVARSVTAPSVSASPDRLRDGRRRGATSEGVGSCWGMVWFLPAAQRGPQDGAHECHPLLSSTACDQDASQRVLRLAAPVLSWSTGGTAYGCGSAPDFDRLSPMRAW